MGEIFEPYRPTIGLHVAAQAGVRHSFEDPLSYVNSNLLGTLSILEAIRRFPVKHFLLASTSSVYGGSQKIPYTELQKTDTPLSFYAATKKSCELMSHSTLII